MGGEFDQITSLRSDDNLILWAFVERIAARLEREGAAAERVIAVLNDPNTCIEELVKYSPEKVSAVKNLLAAVFKNDRSIPHLAEKAQDYDTRFLAITFLGWFGAKARPVIPEFIGTIGSGNPANGAAKRAIQLIGGAEPLVVSAIEQSIANEDDTSFLELIDLALHTPLRHSMEFANLFTLGATSQNADLRWATAFWVDKLPDGQKQRLAKVIDDLRKDSVECVRVEANKES